MAVGLHQYILLESFLRFLVDEILFLLLIVRSMLGCSTILILFNLILE